MVGEQLQGRGTMLEGATRCHREDLGCPCRVFLPKRCPELITIPDIVSALSELTMIIFRIGIEAGSEGALLGPHLAPQPGTRLGGNAFSQVIAVPGHPRP